MNFNIQEESTYTIITVWEEKLNALFTTELKEKMVAMCNNGIKNIILDLSRCKYCDSAGLGAILMGHRSCKNANGVFMLSGLNNSIERLINISQLSTILNICTTLDEAIEKIMIYDMENLE